MRPVKDAIVFGILILTALIWLSPMYFQNAYAVLVLPNFFVRETLFRKLMALY